MQTKLTFKKWLALEQLRTQIQKAVESGEFPDRVYAYLSTAFGSADETKPWENSVFLFIKATTELQPKQIPLLQPHTEKEKPVSWDYEGRIFAYWSHILAKAYGWTLEYIGELDVNEALAMIQEIMTDDQLDREFVYGLSEIAYPYNASTKRSVYKPLPRPYWMKENVKPLKKFKFRRDLLPVGLVEDISGMPAEYNPLRDTVVYKKEKTDPAPSP